MKVLASGGRRAVPFRRRLLATCGAVAIVQVAGIGMLLVGMSNCATAVLLTAALFANTRGLIHAADVDLISVIDNSLRKFIDYGRRPTSVGLVFSAGHSTVVLLMGILVASGCGVAVTLMDESSGVASARGFIGLAVSGVAPVLLGLNNSAVFLAARRAHALRRHDPTAEVGLQVLQPRGAAGRILTRPLRRVGHPIHVYAVGLMFRLGFDTASIIGLLMLTGAAVAGASPFALLALPLLFDAGMTLGDTINSLLMLRIYTGSGFTVDQRLTYNLVTTGVSTVSAFIVAVLAGASLLDTTGVRSPMIAAIADSDTTYAGYALIAILFRDHTCATLLVSPIHSQTNPASTRVT